ncbi:A24 family peptidase [Ferrimonas pelagia]|uniref:Prepilin leader peptidase/N-methyltransferase n=1 Tax=Ferrimonas pelagia TaxID=1177826 RepID=A0ABP9FFY9_9GAMM
MAVWFELFALYSGLFPLLVGCTGLIVGSFLNVVIHRLPIMMEREWRAEWQDACAEAYPGSSPQPSPLDALPERYNLLAPGSACPQCQTPIPAWRNIPLLSFALQRGQCHQCQAKISLRYPFVELGTGLLSLLLALHLGPTGQFLAAWLLLFGLIALTGIDLDTMLLPDQITLPLLWLGLLLNIDGLFVSLSDAVLGAAIGYLSLWTLFQLFKLLTGKEGMGYGDFKLLALFGAWFGWQALLPTILIASFGGAIVGLLMMASGRLKQGNPMPFGPWIALGGVIYLLWGTQLVSWYLNTMLGGIA